MEWETSVGTKLKRWRNRRRNAGTRKHRRWPPLVITYFQDYYNIIPASLAETATNCYFQSISQSATHTITRWHDTELRSQVAAAYVGGTASCVYLKTTAHIHSYTSGIELSDFSCTSNEY